MELEMSTKSAFDRPRVRPDFYTGMFMGVENVSDGQYGQRLAWKFVIEGKDLKEASDKIKYPNGVELSRVTYKTISPTSMAGSIVSALGQKITDGKFRVESLVGKKVILLIDDFETRTRENEMLTVSSIQKVKPLVDVTEESI